MLFPSPITLSHRLLFPIAVQISPQSRIWGYLLWSFYLGFVVFNLFVDVVTILLMAWGRGRIPCLLWFTNQIRRQLAEISSLLPPCGFSGH